MFSCKCGSYINNMEQGVTNEVLLEKINNLYENNSEAHIEMNDHLRRLNGSVTSLKLWRSYVVGALSVVSAILIPIALMLFSQFLERSK